MNRRTRQIVDDILRREGGYSNHPNDRGGETNRGITQRSWNAYRAKLAPEAQATAPTSVRDIDVNDARNFYAVEYVSPWSWIEDNLLLELVVDSAVNHGATRTAVWLQRAAGVKEDGIVGPVTQGQVNSWPGMTRRMLLRIRLHFYVQIATDGFERLADAEDKDLVFLPGWINRIAEFV